MIALQRLSELCEQWGGKLVFTDQATFDDFFSYEGSNTHRDFRNDISEAPFGEAVGIEWSRKYIYAVEGGPRAPRVGHIIHEMGHVFATTLGPEDCEEFQFFGWEVAVARYVNAAWAWQRSSWDYGVTENGRAFGRLPRYRRRRLLERRVAVAKKLGLVTDDGVPLSVR